MSDLTNNCSIACRSTIVHVTITCRSTIARVAIACRSTIARVSISIVSLMSDFQRYWQTSWSTICSTFSMNTSVAREHLRMSFPLWIQSLININPLSFIFVSHFHKFQSHVERQSASCVVWNVKHRKHSACDLLTRWPFVPHTTNHLGLLDKLIEWLIGN